MSVLGCEDAARVRARSTGRVVQPRGGASKVSVTLGPGNPPRVICSFSFFQKF